MEFVKKLFRSDLNKIWEEETSSSEMKKTFDDSYTLIFFPFAHFKLKRNKFEKDIELARVKIEELILRNKNENDILPIKDFHIFCEKIWLGIHEKKDVMFINIKSFLIISIEIIPAK